MSREVFKRKKYTRKKTPRYKCLYSIVSCFKLWISDANVYVLEWNTQLGNESLVLHVQAKQNYIAHFKAREKSVTVTFVFSCLFPG